MPPPKDDRAIVRQSLVRRHDPFEPHIESSALEVSASASAWLCPPHVRVVVPSRLQEPDTHSARTRAERRPGEGVVLCSGCDQAQLAQPTSPLRRCEPTAVHPYGAGTARSDSRRSEKLGALTRRRG